MSQPRATRAPIAADSRSQPRIRLWDDDQCSATDTNWPRPIRQPGSGACHTRWAYEFHQGEQNMKELGSIKRLLIAGLSLALLAACAAPATPTSAPTTVATSAAATSAPTVALTSAPATAAPTAAVTATVAAGSVQITLAGYSTPA